jgi:hypothetical protein
MSGDDEAGLSARLKAVLGGRAVRKVAVLEEFMLPGIEATTLSCVGPEHRSGLVRTKLWMTALILLVDDLVDTAEERDWAVVEEVFGVMGETAAQQDLGDLAGPVRLAAALWEELQRGLRALPGWPALHPLLPQDWAAHKLAFRRARALQLVPASYDPDHDTALLSHDFGMVVAGMADLMALRTLDPEELAPARRLFRAAQCVARLANDRVTLDKEVLEGDLSNAIILRARRQGTAPVRGGAAWQAVEAQLDGAWAHLEEAAGGVRAFDGAAYVDGVRQLLAIQARYYGSHHGPTRRAG